VHLFGGDVSAWLLAWVDGREAEMSDTTVTWTCSFCGDEYSANDKKQCTLVHSRDKKAVICGGCAVQALLRMALGHEGLANADATTKLKALESRLNAALERHVDHEERIGKLEMLKGAIDWNKMPLKGASVIRPEGGLEHCGPLLGPPITPGQVKVCTCGREWETVLRNVEHDPTAPPKPTWKWIEPNPPEGGKEGGGE